MNLIMINTVSKNSRLSDIDLFFKNLKGVPYFNLNDGFEIPIIWFIINFFVIFSLGNYFYDDFRENGKYILPRVKKVKYFYFSKVLWVICNTLIYYLMIFIIIAVVSNLFLIKSNKWILIEGINIEKSKFIIKTFLMYYTTSTALILLQNTISLILKPVYSFFVILILILISIFIINNLLPGQHSLILRHVPFDDIHNLLFTKSLLYNLVLSIVSVISGYIIFLKKDVL